MTSPAPLPRSLEITLVVALTTMSLSGGALMWRAEHAIIFKMVADAGERMSEQKIETPFVRNIDHATSTTETIAITQETSFSEGFFPIELVPAKAATDLAIGTPGTIWKSHRFSTIGVRIDVPPGFEVWDEQNALDSPGVSIRNDHTEMQIRLFRKGGTQTAMTDPTDASLLHFTLTTKTGAEDIPFPLDCSFDDTIEYCSGSITNGEDTYGVSCWSTSQECHSSFATILSAMTVFRPPFFGVIGAEVPSVLTTTPDLFPNGAPVEYGFLVMDEQMMNAYLPSLAVPSAYETGVFSGSPAEQTKIQAGDIITKVNDRNIISLEEAIVSRKIGSTIVISYIHGDEQTTVAVNLADWPMGFFGRFSPAR